MATVSSRTFTARARSRFTAPFRRRAIGLLLLVAAPATAAVAPAARLEGPAATAYLEQLIRAGATPLTGQAGDCPGDQTAPTVAGTLAAIMTDYADGSAPLETVVRCAPAGTGRTFCTLAFAIKGEESASAGFIFTARAAAGRIEPKSIRCFQTP